MDLPRLKMIAAALAAENHRGREIVEVCVEAVPS